MSSFTANISSLVSTGTPFQYSPLEDAFRSIRLLRLSSRKAAISGVACELHSANLDAGPPYKALSYAWGDPLDKSYITVNGASSRVTQNLYSTVLHLQQDDEEIIIWIDAICINQNDDHEKTKQVQRMTNIYQHATDVFVWLGPSHAGSDELMERLHKISMKIIKGKATKAIMEPVPLWRDCRIAQRRNN